MQLGTSRFNVHGMVIPGVMERMGLMRLMGPMRNGERRTANRELQTLVCYKVNSL